MLRDFKKITDACKKLIFGAFLITAISGCPESWNTEGGKILFSSSRSGSPNSYMVYPKTGRVEEVGVFVGDAARFSPDGKNIAYLKEDDLYLRNIKGSKEKLLIENVSAFTWHPNGKEIAYFGLSGINIYTFDLNTSQKKILAKDVLSDSYIDFSPDGMYTLHQRDGIINGESIIRNEFPNEPWKLDSRKMYLRLYGIIKETYRLRVFSGSLERIISSSYGARYSLDGQIAFLRYDEKKKESYIWIADSDGKNEKRLTEGGRTKFQESGSSLAWSPDGKMVAFDKAVGEAVGTLGARTTDIFVINKDGTGEKNLTNDNYPDRMYDWSK